MTRHITTHKAPGEETLNIMALDQGLYMLMPKSAAPGNCIVLQFQSGSHPHGLTIESLLAVAADQLMQHQKGASPCADNATALTNIRAAINTLHGRTVRLKEEQAKAERDFITEMTKDNPL